VAAQVRMRFFAFVAPPARADGIAVFHFESVFGSYMLLPLPQYMQFACHDRFLKTGFRGIVYFGFASLLPFSQASCSSMFVPCIHHS